MTDGPPPLTTEALASWTDQELLTEWEDGAWAPGDGSSEAIADEMDRRRLKGGSGLSIDALAAEVERRGMRLSELAVTAT
ncbi:hypothetical protein ACMGDM_16410 [Sphingomonas sp. DT-51]|uniref:hypothetical protein n=1 Tax=Sphingomonas sp. DT-51 TaxID=3396165 RepID=UPI003F1DD9B4